MAIKLRTATVDDAVQLQVFSRRTFAETFAESNSPEDLETYLEERLSFEQISAELCNPESIFILAESAGELLAFAKVNWGTAQTVARGAHSFELERLYVVKHAKGKGLGSILMEWALNQARANGAEELWLGVWEHNLEAREFYARHGFSEVGSHIFTLGSDAQTDLILAKPLS